ncbi:hypothetical protein D9M73_296670 [compost metagenome]
MIAAVLHARFHAGQVRAGVRFGHGDGKDGLAADATWQIALALLLVAEALQIGSDDA